MKPKLTALTVLTGALLLPAGAAHASPACQTADVGVRLAHMDAGAGNVQAVFRIVNRSHHRCHTFGYPGVALLGKHRHRLHLHVKDSRRSYFGNIKKRRVNLRRGGRAFFRLSYTDIPGPHQKRCHAAHYLRLIMPDNRGARRFHIRQAIRPCRHRLTVSPITRHRP
jgi:hypothetical protein